MTALTAVKGSRKDAFLIARIPSSQKQALLKLAKSEKVSLSVLIRDMIGRFVDSNGEYR